MFASDLLDVLDELVEVEVVHLLLELLEVEHDSVLSLLGPVPGIAATFFGLSHASPPVWSGPSMYPSGPEPGPASGAENLLVKV
jgi:hypothetical protein